ncbi:glycosyltransferase family 39 protein [Haloferula sp. BvORR071]|uniref:glycosyltransferase family 39 protein n=1 Tax=Haloferula sp. BvORR071 TaxID=1396141 RepID=UPI00224102C2|nr:glycosyltransferase family 39 protein [Haloferula sp. BvORR071]
MQPVRHAAPKLKELVLVAMAAAIWFCAFIGLRPLADPDEGRYTEISREMAISGDYVTPRLNGVKYFEKPPLVYWLSALTFKAFGVNHFTARLWIAVFAVLGCLLTYYAAYSIYGRAAGIWSVGVLATTLIYYVLAQVILLDMAVSVMISGALFSFLLGVREPRGAKRRSLFMAHYAFMGLATLCKGLIGFLIPGAVMFLWLLLLGRWRSLRPFYPVSGIALFLVIAVPWHVLVGLANHSANHKLDFTWFYFVHEHFERFTTTVHRRFEPWWFFLPILVGGLLPWTVFAWQAVARSLRGGWKGRKEQAEAWFLVIWIVFVMGFFSASQSKLIPYILPVIPACAVLIGRYVAERRREGMEAGFSRGGWAFVVLAVGAGVAIPLIKVPGSHDGLTLHYPYGPGLAAAILLAGAGFTGFALLKRQAGRVAGGMMVTVAVLFVAIASMGRAFDAGSSIALSRILQERLKPEDRVVHVALYAQDMPVYLNRQIDVAGYKGELEFGIDAEPEKTADRFISRARFIEEWKDARTTYAVMRNWYYDKWFSQLGLNNEVIGKSGDLYLVVNRSPSSSL